jgi:hypothetical protein
MFHLAAQIRSEARNGKEQLASSTGYSSLETVTSAAIYGIS